MKISHFIEDAWRRHTAAPLCSGFGICGRSSVNKYVNRNRKIAKAYPKIIPKIIRKSWKTGFGGSRITKNEVRKPIWRRFVPKWPQKSKCRIRSVPTEPFRESFWRSFSLTKLSFSASFFTSTFGRHFERMLMDCGAHFHDFWASKPTPNPKRPKYEQSMFHLRKTYVLEGPGLSFLFWKPIKNGVGTRYGIGSAFLVVFHGFSAWSMDLVPGAWI